MSGPQSRFSKILVRYLVATAGLFFVAVGIVWSILSNLGTAPLSCMAYVLNLRIPSISVGTFTLLVNLSYILIQLVLLRKEFKLKYLLQVVASAILGSFIDLGFILFGWMTPATFVGKLGLTVAAALVTAFGVSLEVVSNGWMLSAEMTVNAFSKVLKKPFGPVKIVMDSLMVVLAAVLALWFFRNPFGAGGFTNITDVLMARVEGVVIGLGTILLAILPGYLMKETDPLVAEMTRPIAEYFKD